MHCRSCEILIEENLKELKGVRSVDVSHKTGKARICFEGSRPDEESVKKAVEAAGYSLGDKEKLSWISSDPRDYRYLFYSLLILAVLYFGAKWLGLLSININTSGGSLGVVVLVGLVAGISSCMALIGGLVLGLAARHSEIHPEATLIQKFRPHLFFNAGRVIGYAVFGGAIGLLGTAFRPSASALGILTILVGAVMIFLGLKLVEIFPALKDKTISLPKFFSRVLGLRKENQEYTHTGAFVGGAMTFFLPCGFTQAMQLYAISTGSFTGGAMVMMLFALGTAPGLLGVGGLSSAFRGQWAKLFSITAGVAVILLGVFNVSNASRLVFPQKNEQSLNRAMQELASSPIGEAATGKSDSGNGAVVFKTVYTSKFDIQPNSFRVKAGQKARLEVDVRDQGFGCMSTIMVPGLYNRAEYLSKGILVLDFVAAQRGQYPITCAMGVERGTITVE